MLKGTEKHKEYWKNRKIDWDKSYFQTHDHPHRHLLSRILASIPFLSLWEVGCGGGANIARFVQDLPGKQYGGSDVSEDAINLCKKKFKGGMFYVQSSDDLLLSDKCTDVVLSDMHLIYVAPWHIRRYLREIKRIGRSYVVLCEFHSESFLKRNIARLGGYHVYNYKRLLEREGFYDIMVQKIPESAWPGTDSNTEFRYIITARIPNKY